MDGHERGSLNDEALDREIGAVLTVEPSPAFRARVRARVAEERIRSTWSRTGLTWAGAATAAVAITVAGLAVFRSAGAPVASPQGPELARLAPAPRRAAEPLFQSPRASRRDAAPPTRPRSLPVVRHVPVRPSSQPRGEVLVSPEDSAALRELVAALAHRQVEADDIPPLGAEMNPLPPIKEIVLEPIKLSPMDGLESE